MFISFNVHGDEGFPSPSFVSLVERVSSSLRDELDYNTPQLRPDILIKYLISFVDDNVFQSVNKFCDE